MSSNSTERPVQAILALLSYFDLDSDIDFDNDADRNWAEVGTDHVDTVVSYIDGLEATVEDYEEDLADMSGEIADLRGDNKDLRGELDYMSREVGRLRAEAANARDVVQTPAVEPAHEAALAKVAHLEHQVTALTQELAGAQTRLIAIGLLLR